MIKRIHFICVAGRAMGALAIALKQQGHHVTGSDHRAIPPMSLELEAAGIPIVAEYRAENLEPKPDYVVCGMVMAEDNPEYLAARERGLRVLSFPQLMEEFLLPSTRNLVVAGTKGKTTTTSMLIWIGEHCGLSYNFLVGGNCLGLPGRARFRPEARFAALEGDEYISAPFHQEPKFHYYRPSAAVLTNVYPEHEEFFPTRRDYAEVFNRFLQKIPADGAVYCWRFPEEDEDTNLALSVGGALACQVVRLGFEGDEGADETVRVLEQAPTHSVFEVFGQRVWLNRPGLMNIRNATQALALAIHHGGADPAAAAAALAEFPDVVRRQQVIGCPGGLTIIDDEASHPRAVEALMRSIRQRFPENGRHIIFHPRFLGERDGYYQKLLPEALADANTVILMPTYFHPLAPRQENAFCESQFVDDLRSRGVEVIQVDHQDETPAVVRQIARPGDVVVTAIHNSIFAFVQEFHEAMTKDPIA